MRGQGFLGALQFESQHRVSYHHLTLSVQECVWRCTLYIRSSAADKVFFCLPPNSYLCFRAKLMSVRVRGKV